MANTVPRPSVTSLLLAACRRSSITPGFPATWLPSTTGPHLAANSRRRRSAASIYISRPRTTTIPEAARMRKDTSQGVVDGKLRVFGVEKLRVIDASVLPVIPDCRIQNSVYMAGEKGADMVKAAYPDLYAQA
ncbi:hypothetical protein VTI74DRAFT_9230 [Chaetomium olivicolor]